MRSKHILYKGLLKSLVISVIIISTQCVEEYNPNITANTNLMVVNGSIVRGNERHTITVSRSTSVQNPQFNPVEACKVYVTDDRNNVFRFEEKTPGKYDAEIDDVYLSTGARFKLTIETPGNEVYESGFEEIYASPPIDSLYFLQENNYSEFFNRNEDGMRCNVDIYEDEEFVGYYRWKIHETWEYRSSIFEIEKMLTGVKDTFITTYKYDTLNSEWRRDRAIPIPEFVYFNQPDTFYICYLDSEVEEIFFSSTSDIAANSRKRVPLHFIPYTPKLTTRYSCLVSQYALSEGAYTYFKTKETEIEESGGLYNSQPSQNLSNIKNTNDDQETVLGYFWVSASAQKRVFFEGPYLGEKGYCAVEPFEIENFYTQDPDSAFGVFRRIPDTYFPVYVTNNSTTLPGCFDCRFSGGTLERPDFW